VFNGKEIVQPEMQLDKSRTFQYIKIGGDGRRYFAYSKTLLFLRGYCILKKIP